jgi:hypothetical protein
VGVQTVGCDCGGYCNVSFQLLVKADEIIIIIIITIITAETTEIENTIPILKYKNYTRNTKNK